MVFKLMHLISAACQQLDLMNRNIAKYSVCNSGENIIKLVFTVICEKRENLHSVVTLHVRKVSFGFKKMLCNCF